MRRYASGRVPGAGEHPETLPAPCGWVQFGLLMRVKTGHGTPAGWADAWFAIIWPETQITGLLGHRLSRVNAAASPLSQPSLRVVLENDLSQRAVHLGLDNNT